LILTQLEHNNSESNDWKKIIFSLLALEVKLNLVYAVFRVDSDAKQMLRKESAITFSSHFAILD